MFVYSFLARHVRTRCYVSNVEQRLSQLEGELAALRDSEERLRNLYAESQQREKVLVRRLAAKEQEMQDCMCQLADLKAAQAPNSQALRSTLLDPSVNVLLQLLRQELVTTRARLEETQNELSAWKFTPDSNTGKRLMAKCRQLYQENEELGKMTSSGRVAKLEGELALQKSFSEEVKKSQTELDEFVQDLDEDVEGMQSTIYYLQQELRKSNETVAALQSENGQLRTVRVNGTTHLPPSNANGRTTVTEVGDGGHGVSVCDRRTDSASDSEPELIIKVSEQEMCDEDSSQTVGRGTTGSANAVDVSHTGGISSSCGGSSSAVTNKRTYDSDSSKVRRSSVLSLDYNDDDALVISTNGDVAMSDAE
ncbi:female lethal d [Carabus blaptoides fortunei]